VSAELGLLAPAFLTGLLVLATHVPLGLGVLARGILFIDLAVAQFAGLGVILAHFLGWESAWAVQGAALGMALLGAALLHQSEKRWPQRQEAVIGVAFVVSASLAILLLAHDPQGGEHLRDLLAGQILWTTWSDLPVLVGATALVLAAWFGGLKDSPLGFYLLFAAAITASVQVMGVYLVFASLIIPALAARGRLIRGYGVGAAGYALGLLASYLLDLPAGAAIVVALALASALFVLGAVRRTT
jgi:zinc/manganese transport system permease protein